MHPEIYHYWIFGYALLSILAYTLFYNAPARIQVPRYWRSKDRQTAIALVIIQRTLGFLLFGVIPVLSVTSFKHLDPAQTGLSLNNPWETFSFTLITVLLILPFNYLNGQQPDTQNRYPQIRVQHWTLKLFSVNSIFWILYLWGYEYLFRGFLFFTSLEVMSLHWAIVLNIGLYAFAHWPKGWREVLGAVPFGLLLCVITYLTGNFWYAFLAHSFLAISAEWFTLQSHPEMVFVENKHAEKDWR